MDSVDPSQSSGNEPVPAKAPWLDLSRGVKWLAIAEFAIGIGALIALGETNPGVYLLVIGVALIVVGLVESDQRRRQRAQSAAVDRPPRSHERPKRPSPRRW